MKIVFWGTPSFSIKSLEKLHSSDNEIIGVVTQPDKKRSRGSKLISSPVKKRSLELGLSVYMPEKIKENSLEKEKILNLDADIYIVVAFGQILPSEVLSKPKYGCWNSHASILPKWRGAAPIQRALINGDKKTGVGIMLMEKGLDTGPVILEKKIGIDEFDNHEILSNKLSNISGDLLLELINIIECKRKLPEFNINQDLDLKKQSEIHLDKVTYANMINKKELKIDWSSSSASIHRKVMGLYPNAFTTFNNKRVKILSTSRIDYLKEKDKLKMLDIIKINNMSKPGNIVFHDDKIGILVKSKDSFILIKRGKLEGKNEVESNVLFKQLNAKINYHFD